MPTEVTITSVEFRNFKALKNYSIKMNSMNILVGPNNSGKSTIISSFRVLEVGIRQANHKKATLVLALTVSVLDILYHLIIFLWPWKMYIQTMQILKQQLPLGYLPRKLLIAYVQKWQHQTKPSFSGF